MFCSVSSNVKPVEGDRFGASAQRVLKRWHVCAHADPFIAEVERVEQIRRSPGAGEDDRDKQSLHGHAGRAVADVEDSRAEFLPGRLRADGDRHDDEAERHDDNENLDRSLDGQVRDLRPEENRSRRAKRHDSPERVGAESLRSHEDRLQREPRRPSPPRREPREHREQNEQRTEPAPYARKARVDRLPGRHGPSRDLEVHPHLQEDPEDRGPHHRAPVLGNDPGPDDDLSGTDGQAHENRAGPSHPPEGELPLRKVPRFRIVEAREQSPPAIARPGPRFQRRSIPRNGGWSTPATVPE